MKCAYCRYDLEEYLRSMGPETNLYCPECRNPVAEKPAPRRKRGA